MMRRILVALLLMTIPHWLSATLAGESENKEVCYKKFVMADGGKSGKVRIKVLGDKDNEGAVAAYAFVSADEAEGKDGRSEPQIIKLLRPAKIDKDHGWLGVSIGNVSETLADQLGTDGKGTVILNVVEGSPADKAGLQAHDVILFIDGEEVGEKVSDAVNLIRAHKPSEDIELLILRDSREQRITVTLGSRADRKGFNFSWKFEGSPLAEIEDKIITRGKILCRGDNGEWIFKDLGDLEELKNLPAHIRMVIPRSGSRTIVINKHGESSTMKIEVNRDGSTIAIEQEGDREITVTRTDEDGRETVKTYETEDDLRDDDEKAYELYSKTGKVHLMVIDTDGLEAIGDFDFDFDFDGDFKFEFDTEAWQENMAEWREKLEESLSEIRVNAAKSMDELRKMLAELQDDEGHTRLLKLHKLGRGLFGEDRQRIMPALMRLRSFGKPKYSFEIHTDGTIKAKIRKGDTEVVQLFSDEDDLADRDPKLFGKYHKLMSDDE